MKTTSKAIIWIIVVFLTGVLFGSALTFVIYQPHRPPWAARGSRENRSPDRFVQLVTDELGLDEEQREQLRTLMIESRDQFRDQFDEARQTIRMETRKKLQAILSPDQLERFDEFMAKAPPQHPFGKRRKPGR